MADRAAALISAGAAKSGNPCARFTAPCCAACRVISRITDSVNCETLSLRKCFVGLVREEITSAIAGRLAHRVVILRGAFVLAKRGQMRSRRTPYPHAQPQTPKEFPSLPALSPLHSPQLLQRRHNLPRPLRNLLIPQRPFIGLH